MSVSLTVNGVVFSYPQTGDKNWSGTNGADAWAAAITTGMLSKSGGAFTLTADTNFGTSFGLVSKYLTSQTANPAGSGVIRLANTDGIGWRNAGSTADFLLKPDADGILQYNSIDLVNLSTAQTLTNKAITGTFVGPLTGAATSLVSATANPATTGVIELANTDNISWRNAANNANVSLTLDGSNNLNFGGNPLFSLGGTLKTTALPAFTGADVTSTAGSANLNVVAIQGTTLTGVTGTGKAVLSISPTFTGTVGAAAITATGQVTANSLAVTSPVSTGNGGTGNTTGTATINANLTGPITSVGNTTSVNAQTGTGSTFVMNTSPTLVTPALGAASATSLTLSSPLTVANGGTGLATLTASNVILGAGTSTPTFVAPSTTGNVLQSNGSTWVSAAPAAVTFKSPTFQKFTVTGTTTGYLFTVTSANATVGATYTDSSSHVYTVLATISSATQLFTVATTPASVPTSTTLTKTGGTGDSTITFSAYVALGTYTTPTSPAPLYIQVELVGAGGGGSAVSGNSSIPSGGNGGASSFGFTLFAGGGSGAGSSGGSGGAATIISGIPVAGQAGTDRVWGNASPGTSTAGGVGGSNPLGFGGSSINGSGGLVGTGYGAGGGGAGGLSATYTASGGGAGAYLKEWISSPASTYYYRIGVAGTAGTGTSNNGAAGTAGFLLVTESYQ